MTRKSYSIYSQRGDPQGQAHSLGHLPLGRLPSPASPASPHLVVAVAAGTPPPQEALGWGCCSCAAAETAGTTQGLSVMMQKFFLN